METTQSNQEEAMKSLSALFIATGLVLATSSALAGQVQKVEVRATTGAVSQAAAGQNNENNVDVGNVKLKSTTNAGGSGVDVRTGNISQSVRGKDNKNQVKVGSVE
jgi:hypothetical protein